MRESHGIAQRNDNRCVDCLPRLQNVLAILLLCWGHCIANDGVVSGKPLSGAKVPSSFGRLREAVPEALTSKLPLPPGSTDALSLKLSEAFASSSSLQGTQQLRGTQRSASKTEQRQNQQQTQQQQQRRRQQQQKKHGRDLFLDFGGDAGDTMGNGYLDLFEQSEEFEELKEESERQELEQEQSGPVNSDNATDIEDTKYDNPSTESSTAPSNEDSDNDTTQGSSHEKESTMDEAPQLDPNRWILARQTFNDIPSTIVGKHNMDRFPVGTVRRAVTNPAASFRDASGSSWSFATYWTETRDDVGPCRIDDPGDAIGVNFQRLRNRPNVSPQGIQVTSTFFEEAPPQAEQNFEFNDADGLLELMMDPVALTPRQPQHSAEEKHQLATRMESLHFHIAYWVAKRRFPPRDSFRISIVNLDEHHGSSGNTTNNNSTCTLLDVQGDDIASLAQGDGGRLDEWHILDVALLSACPHLSFDWQDRLQVVVGVDNGNGNDNIFVDDLVLYYDLTVPPFAVQGTQDSSISSSPPTLPKSNTAPGTIIVTQSPSNRFPT